VIVFHPNQLKSATHNTGEFSLENDDVRFQVSEGMSKKFRKQIMMP